MEKKYRRKVNEILKEYQAGDLSRGDELFQETRNHLKYVAYMYAYDKRDWQDILSDAYLRVHTFINNFDPKKDGYNWLCKIVQNVAYDYNKKNPAFASLSELEQLRHFDYCIDERLTTNDEVMRLLESLGLRDRRMIILRFFFGKTYAQIGEILHMTGANAHKQVKRILETLRANVEEWEKD